MKRLRLDKWATLSQPPRNPRSLANRGVHFFQTLSTRRCIHQQPLCTNRTRNHWSNPARAGSRRRTASTIATEGAEDNTTPESVLPYRIGTRQKPVDTPSLGRIAQSSKLSALHARLALPAKLPLRTLARCLIDASASPRAGYNNAPLAVLGSDLLGSFTAEYLLCKYPRLPMAVTFAAQYAYVGSATLAAMRAEWGVELVTAPGPEVDPGLLQFKRLLPARSTLNENSSLKEYTAQPQNLQRSESRIAAQRWRRSLTSTRVVHSDQFGEPLSFPSPAISRSTDQIPSSSEVDEDHVDNNGNEESTGSEATSEAADSSYAVTLEAASAAFVRALAGSLYLHAGAQAVKDFHRDHILSRHLQLHTLFNFTHPTRDLSRLCAREGFEPPVARLLSETGRLSRTPVFVVGVFSGDDKLGEGVGSSLNEARVRASGAALRSWYLYSPPSSDIMMPSDVEGSSATKTWKSQMIDVGEVIT